MGKTFTLSLCQQTDWNVFKLFHLILIKNLNKKQNQTIYHNFINRKINTYYGIVIFWSEFMIVNLNLFNTFLCNYVLNDCGSHLMLTYSL